MSSDQVLAREPAAGFPLDDAAVQLSLDSARAADRAGLHTAVLDIMAVLAADGVRRALLHAAGQTGILIRGRRVPADEVDQALTQLADRSLLTVSPDGQTISMRGPVAQLARAGLARAAPLTVVCRTAASMLEAQADALAKSPDEAAARDIPDQVAALRENAGPAAESDEQLAVVLLRLRCWMLYQLIERGGSAPQVIEVGEPLTAELERVLGPDHPDTVNARNSLATAYQAAGRAAEAIPLFEHILVARQRALGPMHPDTLNAQNSLAATCQDVGRFAEAILLFKLTVAARERLFGADHHSTLNSRINLAAAYRAMGQVSEAIPLLEQTVAAQERVLGADHPDARTARDNLTAARQETDQADVTLRLVLPVELPSAMAEQQPAEEKPAEQGPAEEPVPSPVESLAAPSSDDAAPEPIPEPPVDPADEEKLPAAPPDEEPLVAAAESDGQASPEPAPIPEPPAPQDMSQPTPPAEEPPVAAVATEPPAPPAAEEPPSAAAPLRPAPWWRLRKPAIKRRPEPVPALGPEPELQAPQDVSEPAPSAEEPPAPQAAEELLAAAAVEEASTEEPPAVPAVEEAAAEELPDAPLSEEPPAAAADVELPAPPAAEEPPSAAAPPRAARRWRLRKRAIERHPEHVSVPGPEPELQALQDVSGPTPSAEEPPAPQAAGELLAAVAVEEAVAQEPPAAPPAEKPSAAAPTEEPPAVLAVEEAAAEQPRDAPLAEEPPAAAAEVEEPAAAAAETGDQASPEPAPVPGPEPELQALQDASVSAPPAEEPPAPTEELSAVSTVEEAAAEEPRDAPLPGEPPAPAAEVEEPAAAAAETEDQALPEPAPVPGPEPELQAPQDVSEPAPSAEEPPAPQAAEELVAAVAVEEAAAEEPPDAPLAEEQPAAPLAEEPPAAPEGRRPAPARDRPARRRRRVPSLVAAIVVVLAVGGVAGFLSRPHTGNSGHNLAASRGAGSQPLSAAPQLAAAWVAQQVAPSTIVACDPLMCSALEAQGVPAANLLVLRADTTSPLGAQVVVVTPAVRSQFGSRLASVYAPSVIAGFGSGPDQVSVQVVAKNGPAAYLTALRQDAADRKTAGAQLLANKHIQASAEARAQLAAGAVDSRLLIMLPALAAVHPIQVLAFGDPSPGAGPGVPLCSANLSGSGQAAKMSDVIYLRWLTSFIGTQLVPFAGSMSVLQEVGQPVVRVVFAQPSPLGLLAHA